MNIRMLKYAIALDEHRSFHRAARASNISPSALSRAISALEAEFDLQFFDRTTRKIVTTPAGREFISAARMMVLSGEDLRTRMQFLKDATAGSVVFGMAPLPAGLFLPRFLVRMLQEVPQINVHAKTGTAQDLLAHVDDGSIEFLICTDTAVGDVHPYQVEELCSFDLFLMTRREHPLAGLEEVCPEQIRPYPMLGGAFPNNMWPASEGYVATHTICNNYDAIFAGVLATDACCLAPRIDQEINGMDPHRFAFTRFSERLFTQRSSVILLHQRDRPLSLAAKLALEQLRHVISATTIGQDLEGDGPEG